MGLIQQNVITVDFDHTASVWLSKEAGE